MTEAPDAPDAAAQISGLVFAVILLDSEQAIREANPSAEELLERSAQRLAGTNLFDLVTIADRHVRASLEEAEVPLGARDVAIVVGERQHRVNITSSPMVVPQGWRVVTLTDIGPNADDGENRSELRAPAVLAHEIKNPLAAIRGASQLLERRAAERDAPLARMITGEVDRIAQLIDRMQELGSRSAVEMSACNLHSAIRNAVTTVRAARAGEVEVVEEFDPSLPPVAADRGALEQVLINLVANACEAAESAREPRVTIRTRFVSGLVLNAIRLGKATRLPVEVTVTDNGAGIDPEIREQIFEPFVSAKRHGQGLGLALVRKLVTDMGGRIGHERDERAGLTRFRMNLAVAEAA